MDLLLGSMQMKSLSEVSYTGNTGTAHEKTQCDHQ